MTLQFLQGQNITHLEVLSLISSSAITMSAQSKLGPQLLLTPFETALAGALGACFSNAQVFDTPRHRILIRPVPRRSLSESTRRVRGSDIVHPTPDKADLVSAAQKHGYKPRH